jgi:hypothetical protein
MKPHVADSSERIEQVVSCRGLDVPPRLQHRADVMIEQASNLLRGVSPQLAQRRKLGLEQLATLLYDRLQKRSVAHGPSPIDSNQAWIFMVSYDLRRRQGRSRQCAFVTLRTLRLQFLF